MPVGKFSISLPEELVADVDEIASDEGLTRSAVIREAASRYVAARRTAQYERQRRERMDEALRGLEDIAASWGEDDRSGAEYLREIRGDSHGTRAPEDGPRSRREHE